MHTLIEQLKHSDIQAAGICLLHAFQNDAHEQRVADLLRDALPDLITCTSSDVVPEIGEFERMSTTVANAYVLPIFSRYLAGITRGLKQIGINHPLYLMLSDGGTVHESTAIRHPIRLFNQAPQAGFRATSLMGENAGCPDVFCFDMGGTTAKACLIDDGEPLRGNEFEVARVFRFKKGSGLPLRIPVIDMIEIGAGGIYRPCESTRITANRARQCQRGPRTRLLCTRWRQADGDRCRSRAGIPWCGQFSWR